jgi:hypothetical protein
MQVCQACQANERKYSQMSEKSPRIRKSCFILTIGIVLILLSSCSSASPGQPGQCGITGTVMIGPIPYKDKAGQFYVEPHPDATIWVMDVSGTNQVAEFKSDAEGHFKTDLAPGQYLLVPQTPEGQTSPVGEPKKVVVRQKGYTDVILYYDSEKTLNISTPN